MVSVETHGIEYHELQTIFTDTDTSTHLYLEAMVSPSFRKKSVGFLLRGLRLEGPSAEGRLLQGYKSLGKEGPHAPHIGVGAGSGGRNKRRLHIYIIYFLVHFSLYVYHFFM